MSGAAEIAAGLSKGWLAASFLAPNRDWRDVPLCIRTRSTAFTKQGEPRCTMI